MPDTVLVEGGKDGPMLYPRLVGKYDELLGEEKKAATSNTGRVFKQRLKGESQGSTRYSTGGLLLQELLQGWPHYYPDLKCHR